MLSSGEGEVDFWTGELEDGGFYDTDLQVGRGSASGDFEGAHEEFAFFV